MHARNMSFSLPGARHMSASTYTTFIDTQQLCRLQLLLLLLLLLLQQQSRITPGLNLRKLHAM
jgi:hypothetical protein